LKYVLFVCNHNAGRSQMAQAFFERHAPDDVRAESAGSIPGKQLWPNVVEVMRELDIDLSGRRPRKLTVEMQLHADWAVTMGCGDACPYVPTRVEDWEILDPAEQPIEVRTHLQGRFNVSNALGAFVAAVALGVPSDKAAEGLAGAESPPGRFEPVDEGQPFAVLVDYAHTPDSLANVLKAAREMTVGRLVVVFGAGGDRDRDKRPKMGRAAAELADLAIVTSDNPRSEEPEAIIEEILAGSGRGPQVEVEPDRRAAIRRAIAEAGDGDVVVIAGKGHEQGQTFADRTVPFSDVEEARDALRRLLEKATA